MQVTLPEQLVLEIGFDKLEPYDVEENSLRFKRFVQISLKRLTQREIANLKSLVMEHKDIRGTATVLKDIETWEKALKDAGQVRIRRVQQFEQLLIEFLLKVPGRRLFAKHDKDGNAWLCYYVSKVEYHPEYDSEHRHYPERVTVRFVYDQYGTRQEFTETFLDEDLRGKRVVEVLANFGYYAETPEMRAQYMKEIERYSAIFPQIGKQYLVNGIGVDDVPKEESDDRYDRSNYGRGGTIYHFSDVDKRNRVVIDVFREKEPDEYDRVDLHAWWWQDKIRDARRRAGDRKPDPTETIDRPDKTENDHLYGKRDGMDVEDYEDEPAVIEVPVHPFLVCFDLQRHMRLAVHVNYLQEYVYDEQLADKLILPQHVKELVKTIVDTKAGNFKDIVAGKGGGAIILLTGPPGTGKTLTAEVYAEAEKKALYSVQASQLGTDPDELEKKLMKVLMRARRWNAVALIDEADVYVHERGNDLTQNSIVGVFLRVLEYHASVLFLTTNRPDLVDDAIASRCVARIDYAYPTAEQQTEIWKVLSGTSGIKIADDVIAQWVAKHPHTSGRDVKNLLKLVGVISTKKEKEIDLDMLEFALQFKPTVGKGEKA